MWAPSRTLRVWLCLCPVDMRKSYDGLSAMTKQALGEDPLDGSVYVFVNRRRTQMKCLYFEGDGYCIWSKRLERGGFQVHWSEVGKTHIDMSTLRLLIDGIEPQSVHRFKRYHHPQPVSVAV